MRASASVASLLFLLLTCSHCTRVTSGSAGPTPPGGVPVHLRERTVYLSSTTRKLFVDSLRASSDSARHALVWLARLPDSHARDTLRAAGIAILAAHHGNVYWARVARTIDTTDALIRPVLLASLDPSDRVDPAIWKRDYAKFQVRLPSGPANYLVNSDGSLNLSVAFHDEVAPTRAAALLGALGRDAVPVTGSRWRFVADSSAVRHIAASDLVRWVGGAPPPLMPDNDDMRKAVRVDGVQNFDVTDGTVKGLGGAGIQVGIFDSGIDEAHPDFANRVVFANAGALWHGTHVAGVLAGSGASSTGTDSWSMPNNGSPFEWRGVAPQAQLLDLDGGTTFTDDDIHSYITLHGMDLSNHSTSYSYDGEYSPGDADNDNLIRGDAKTSGGNRIPARLRVYSTGNHGEKPFRGGEQTGYFSLTKQSKNALVVGNYDAWAGRISPSSSLGPTHDGRIKPDVVAPGSNVRSTGYCIQADQEEDAGTCTDAASGAVERRNYYRTVTGSSVSAPVVTGILALVLQQHEATNGVLSEVNRPWPSTLKAIAVQSARDIVGPVWFANEDAPVQAFKGPDFVTGFGLVNATAAVAIVAEKRTIQDSLMFACATKVFPVTVPKAGSLRVTLAWDDPTGSESLGILEPKLINDLDVELVSPTGDVHYPYLLDQVTVNGAGNPIPDANQTCPSTVVVRRKVLPTMTPKFEGKGASSNENDPFPDAALKPAVRGKDHLNNVEQVVVESAEIGEWTIRVTGFRLMYSQRFSLAHGFTPLIVIAPRSVCEWFGVCPYFLPLALCARHPLLCAERQLQGHGGFLPVEFRSRRDRFLLPMDRACEFALDCEPCAGAGMCVASELMFHRLPGAFTIEVWERGGQKVFSDHTSARTKRVRFHRAPGREYLLVIGPTSDRQVGRKFELPFTTR